MTKNTKENKQNILDFGKLTNAEKDNKIPIEAYTRVLFDAIASVVDHKSALENLYKKLQALYDAGNYKTLIECLHVLYIEHNNDFPMDVRKILHSEDMNLLKNYLRTMLFDIKHYLNLLE